MPDNPTTASPVTRPQTVQNYFNVVRHSGKFAPPDIAEVAAYIAQLEASQPKPPQFPKPWPEPPFEADIEHIGYYIKDGAGDALLAITWLTGDEAEEVAERVVAALNQTDAPVPTSGAVEAWRDRVASALSILQTYNALGIPVDVVADLKLAENELHEVLVTHSHTAEGKPRIKSAAEWAREISEFIPRDALSSKQWEIYQAKASAIIEKAVLNGRWELRHAPNVTSSRWADQVVRCLKQMFPNWEKGYDWKNSRSENDKFVFDPQCANEAIDAIRKYEDYLIKGDFGFVADRSAMRSAAFEEGRKSALADGKLREALLEKWHKLPEPRCRKIDGEGPNAAKHNAKVAADLEDGKTYLMYDHHRSAFWGPNNSGYQFRKGAGFYDKAAALKVLAGSSRYFTAEEVPADILAALAQPASGGGD